MGSDEVRISFSVEPSHCILRLEGALGVGSGEDLRQTALELAAYQKDVQIDWSAATQIDASTAQVLLSLRTGLAGQNRSFHSTGLIPDAIQSWLRTAGLADIFGSAGPGA